MAQKAVEFAWGADRKTLLEALQPHIMELCTSPFGNLVLSKVVQVMPSAWLNCIIEAFSGKVLSIARHRYGGRLLERLIEHCNEDQISCLLDEIVADAESLSQHSSGNFVVQRALEHGTSAQVMEIMRRLCARTESMSQHRYGSHVVECALGRGDETGRDMLVQALLGDCDVVGVACSRFGVLVIERLADLPTSHDIVKERLIGGLHFLEVSRFGRRVLDAFNVTIAESDNRK